MVTVTPDATVEFSVVAKAWRSDYDASAIVCRLRKFNVVENSLDRVAVAAVPASEWDRLHDMWEASENDAECSDASSHSSADLNAGESRLGRKRARRRFFGEEACVPPSTHRAIMYHALATPICVSATINELDKYYNIREFKDNVPR